MPKRKKPTAAEKHAERLTHDCPHCGALAGFPCTNFKGEKRDSDGWQTPMCQERGRPEVTAKKLQRKADEKNARALKEYGGDNTLLTYLHEGADNLLAAEGVEKVTPEQLAEQKLHSARFKEDCGHAEHALVHGLNWIVMNQLRRETAELIGAEWERILWEGASRTFSMNLSYICGRYQEILCTTNKVVLGYERKFDPARVKTWYLEPNEYRANRIEYKNDGWYVEPTATWPPEGYVPVMTRDEFNARFALHHLSVRPAEDLREPDDGGLFEKTIGVLKSRQFQHCAA